MSAKLKSIITCDLDGKIETLSEGAQKLFGYSEDEMIGKGRVSDFSPGQIVLGHVVNWLNESVEKEAGEYRIPEIGEENVPVYNWECKYCPYYQIHCEGV